MEQSISEIGNGVGLKQRLSIIANRTGKTLRRHLNVCTLKFLDRSWLLFRILGCASEKIVEIPEETRMEDILKKMFYEF